MSADGGHGPKPYTQRQARTVFLRVPPLDWPAVKRGLKTEFRGSPGRVSGLKWIEPPTPVVAYTLHEMRGYEAELMILEDTWKEPLGAISEESLRREGVSSLHEFRRYWLVREKRRFPPTRMVTVYRVRRWRDDDAPMFAERLLERLYGAFLPASKAEAKEDLG